MWIDISMPLHNRMIVWPGDTPFQYTLDATYENDGANVGQIQMSLHAGTHIDAPYHYDPNGKAIDSLPLQLFIGPAYIAEFLDIDQITISDLQRAAIPFCERILFKTKNAWHSTQFEEAFTSISPEAIHYLKELGVKLIGMDSPSVDPFSSELEAHTACREEDIYIIENLRLEQVTSGEYDFIGLPLYIRGADASPIRAVVKKR